MLLLLIFFHYFYLGEKARDKPYEVNITIPVLNYAPVQFTFAKLCGEHENVNIQQLTSVCHSTGIILHMLTHGC